jgi:ubiquinol-cytochrome c reductase cytochrome b subunit
MVQDRNDPKFQESRRLADRARDRALMLARSGVPPEGARYILLRDPLAYGRPIVEQKCLGCHTFGGFGTAGKSARDKGCDLKDFGTRSWIRGLLEDPEASAYAPRVQGKTLGGMKEWKEGTALESKDLDDVADFVATFSTIPADVSVEDWASDIKVKQHRGYKNFVDDCLNCHRVGNLGSESKSRPAPNLFAYGSRQWLARMIRQPGSRLNYGFLGKRQPMPSFDEAQMSENDLRTVVEYIRNEYSKSGVTGTPGEASSRGL